MYSRTYWPQTYWPESYWPKEGADPPDGYWPPRYWAVGYWMPNYWPGEPRLVTEPPQPGISERYIGFMNSNVGRLKTI